MEKIFYTFNKGLVSCIILMLLALTGSGQATVVTLPLNSTDMLGEYIKYNNGSIILSNGFTSAPGRDKVFTPILFPRIVCRWPVPSAGTKTIWYPLCPGRRGCSNYPTWQTGAPAN